MHYSSDNLGWHNYRVEGLTIDNHYLAIIAQIPSEHE